MVRAGSGCLAANAMLVLIDKGGASGFQPERGMPAAFVVALIILGAGRTVG